MRRLTLFLCCFLLLPTIALVAQTDGPCDGFTPRLMVDGRGRVTPGDANNVRAEPSADAELVGQLAGGAVFTVLDGPTCADDLTWWQVAALDDSISGWTVAGTPGDYWLEPGGWLGYTAEQVGLDYHPIANAAKVEALLPNTGRDPFFNGAPDRIEIAFEETAISEYITPRLLVVPVAFFAETDTDLYTRLVQYHGSLYSDAPTPDDIVLFPQVNAALVHDSHVEYIETKTLRGYRFVGMYAQYPAPVRGYEMFYGFSGLTADGTHAVGAVLPLTSADQDGFFIELSETETISNDAGILPEYREILGDHAAALPADAFFPSLDTLDAVMRSLELGDGATLPEPLETRRFERVVLSLLDGATVFSDESEENFITLTYDVYPPGSDVPYLTLQGLSNRAIHTDWQRYMGWRAFVDALDAETPVTELENDPFGFAPQHAPLGEVRRIETEALRGVRFVSGAGRGAMVGPPLTYHFWGITAENTTLILNSTLDVGAIPETAGPSEILAAVDAARLADALAERDEIVLNLTFEVR